MSTSCQFHSNSCNKTIDHQYESISTSCQFHSNSWNKPRTTWIWRGLWRQWLTQYFSLFSHTANIMINEINLEQYLCMAATASLFFTWSSPNDSEKRRASSCNTRLQYISEIHPISVALWLRVCLMGGRHRNWTLHSLVKSWVSLDPVTSVGA